MSRDVSSSMLEAIANEHGYKFISKVEVFPSRVYFDIITDDNAFPSPDTQPASNDPVRQDILHHSGLGLVTFYCDGDLKYALQGNSTPVTTNLNSSKKPGVFGDMLYLIEGTDVNRYEINWTDISNLETSPFSLVQTPVPSNAPVVVHGISETECVVFGNGDGGFSIHYFNGITEILSPARFMFPTSVDWAESSRSMESLGIFSTAFRLGNRVFAYISNACSGIVQGIFYDLDSGVWSDVFTALPTDLQVSLCEFRIANSFVRNGVGYLVGQLLRTDIFQSAYPYTLILKTVDGKSFSIDRFTLVSNLGYRFLGIVGSDNHLYLGNCNRVCEDLSTWVFDGNDDSTSPMTSIAFEDLLATEDVNAQRITLNLPAGDEQVYENAHYVKGARLKLYSGYHTSLGNEYVLHGTYIIETIGKSFANGQRGFKVTCTQEGHWRLTGESMPFYAEIFGLSSLYDPLTEASGKLFVAPSGVRTDTHFYVDFWNHEGYANTEEGITAIDLNYNGGVSHTTISGAHKVAMITKDDLSDKLNSATNPKITGTTLTVKLYGWSRALAIGQANDIVNLILVTCDEDGNNELTEITTDTQNWPITYPYQGAGIKPITLTLTGQTVERFIKKVGVVFEQSVGTNFTIARVEFVNNVELPISLSLANTPWSVEADGTFKVPGSGQPFIMFAQKPYNAWNFTLTSLFENTVTGGVTGYATAVGLVGLAQDAANYVLARFDKTSGKVQLVKSRNGIETVLDEATPGWTIEDIQGIQFIHRDGHFTIMMYRDSTTQYEMVLEHDWIAADGFMYTSAISTRKCGIYGAILSPFVRTLSYASGSQDTVSNSDGLPIDPLADITDFPSSGNLRIGDNVYSYSGKLAHASYVDGPYQFRTCGIYPPPFGNGQAGLECLAFDWYAAENLYAGKFISIDNGSTYICSASLWRVFTTTHNVKNYILGRSRHYSSNNSIGRSTATLANKIMLGIGGFTGVGLISGTQTRHPVGEYAFLELSGTIKCFWFMGTGGESDTTIRDLINTIHAFSGARATFPGDYYSASENINGETTILQDDYAEGFDLEFDLAAPASFEIRTNVKIKPDKYEEKAIIETDTGTKLVFTNLGSGFYSVALISTPSAQQMYKFRYSSGSAKQHFRVLYHENNVSIYHNYKWVTSITLDELIYTQTNYTDIKVYTSSNLEFQDIWVRDLSDWREAVYIDLETDGMAALSSIIQERPIESNSNPDGSIRWYYEMARPEVTLLTEPITHEQDESFPPEGASDAIVYGSKDVVTIHSDLFAQDLGFSTKIIRLPNLNVGKVEAAYRMLKRAYESREHHSLSIRPDVRILPGDVLHVTYTLSVTNRLISFSTIVESVTCGLQSSMRITGRGYLP